MFKFICNGVKLWGWGMWKMSRGCRSFSLLNVALAKQFTERLDNVQWS